MKNCILIFALLIVGCGNRMQPSNDVILDDVTRNSNGETENLDSIRVFVRCTEEAQNYFNKSVDKYINLTNRLLRRFYRGFSNDLENVRNSLLCVIILSNNPCQKQR